MVPYKCKYGCHGAKSKYGNMHDAIAVADSAISMVNYYIESHLEGF